MSLIQDVASEILKHVKHPDDGYRLWEIVVHTPSPLREPDLLEHRFQLRFRDSKTMWLRSQQTGMALDLSGVKSNVELHACGYLHLKAGAMLKRIGTFLQLHLEAHMVRRPPTFNGKALREYPLPDKDAELCVHERRRRECEVYRLYNQELVEDILKLAVGYKLGYFGEG